ncbi:MAG TPA: MFS transporter, partial [Vicinamibacterales bacterium]|nr:MFS transporter [Vicinamibacterales bacterium]
HRAVRVRGSSTVSQRCPSRTSTHTVAGTARSTGVHGSNRRLLAAVSIASFATIFDGTAMTIALPAIGRDLQASFSTLQWIADAMLLAVTGLLLPMGRLGDRIGLRVATIAGMSVFAIVAAATAFASSATWLLALRFLLGLPTAVLVPGTLALLRVAYEDETERARALSLWTAVTSSASALGPLLGGVLVDRVGWRAIPPLTAMLMLAAMVLTWRSKPVTIERQSQTIPAPTSALVLIGFALLLHGLIHAPDAAAARSAAAIAAGLGCLTWATIVDRRRASPLLPWPLMREPDFVWGNFASALVYFAVYGLSFGVAIYTQSSMHRSATIAGAILLPMAIMMLALANRVGRWVAATGGWLVACIGGAIATFGLVMLGPAAATGALAPMLLATAVIGVGFALAIGPLNELMLRKASAEDATPASAFGHATARAAGAIAIALAGLAGLSGADGESARQVTRAFQLAMIACAGMTGVAALVAGWRALRSRRSARDPSA